MFIPLWLAANFVWFVFDDPFLIVILFTAVKPNLPGNSKILTNEKK